MELERARKPKAITKTIFEPESTLQTE